MPRCYLIVQLHITLNRLHYTPTQTPQNLETCTQMNCLADFWFVDLQESEYWKSYNCVWLDQLTVVHFKNLGTDTQGKTSLPPEEKKPICGEVKCAIDDCCSICKFKKIYTCNLYGKVILCQFKAGLPLFYSILLQNGRPCKQIVFISQFKANAVEIKPEVNLHSYVSPLSIYYH